MQNVFMKGNYCSILTPNLVKEWEWGNIQLGNRNGNGVVPLTAQEME